MREINAEQAISILFELPLKKSISTDDIRPIAALIERQASRLKEAGELIMEMGFRHGKGYMICKDCLHAADKIELIKHAPGCRMEGFINGGK